ncbi:MAG: transposase [Thiohalomonadales bacterium]
MNKKFTQGFKEQAVQKALTRGSKNLDRVAQELSVGYSTLQKWIRDYKTVPPKNKKNKRPQDWTREQQFQAIIDTGGLDIEHLSEYCREKGLYPHQLDEWRLNFLEVDTEVAKSSKLELKNLKKENAILQKELRRKEKALAETAALLVLQKKFQALLEDEES